jgi:xanthine dehydrogenase accessory factor
MKSGKARLVKITPDSNTPKQSGVMEYKMTCMSEGSVEVFIEPNLPAPHLIVIGKTAIAKALVKMAKAANYRVTAVAPDATPATFEKVDELITQLNLHPVKITGSSSIVVITQGEQDEAALELALQQPCTYIGFVASRKKKASVFDYLLQQGIDKNLLDRVKSPAGIDINAKKPEEVAISILAEIIQVQSESPVAMNFASLDELKSGTNQSKFYINPVCGIPIDMNNPKHIVDYKGEKVYFCCDGCKIKFDAEPEKYMRKAFES